MSKQKPCRKYNCEVCGIECESRDKRSHLCDLIECRKIYMRQRYKVKLYPKTCTRCLKSFHGKCKEVLCVECKELPKIINYETIIRNILCKRCDTILKQEEVKVNGKTIVGDINGDYLCEVCLNKSRQHSSEIKKGNKNPNYKGGYTRPKYIRKTEKEKEEAKRRVSENMKLNNPMKNPASVAKMKATSQTRKGELGSLIYKKGPEHHLWKGNRTKAQTIRSRLYKDWIFPILQRDNFSCSNCKKDKCRLEVHHNTIPFRDIINKILNDKFASKTLKELNDDEFQLYSNLVVKYHIEHVTGVTLCKECHQLLDPYRK